MKIEFDLSEQNKIINKIHDSGTNVSKEDLKELFTSMINDTRANNDHATGDTVFKNQGKIVVLKTLISVLGMT